MVGVIIMPIVLRDVHGILRFPLCLNILVVFWLLQLNFENFQSPKKNLASGQTTSKRISNPAIQTIAMQVRSKSKSTRVKVL